MTLRVWIFGLVLASPVAAQAAPLPRYGSFVYSGLCENRHTGSLIGSRLTLVRQDKHDVVYYEWSQTFTPGDPRKPFGDNVAVGLQGAAAATSRIAPDGRFTAELSRDPAVHRLVFGQLSAEGFVMDGFEASLWLPRQQDPGAKIPLCPQGPPKLPTR
jgi:hypothetical protein